MIEPPRPKTQGMSSHQSTNMGKDEWLTPPEIIKALGPFDLDPCAPVPSKRPWPTAKQHFDMTTNGLIQPWTGRVWCNPPYGLHIGRWLGRCVEHGNAIVLIFARVETEAWFKHIWPKADAVFFFHGRLAFHHAPSGARSEWTGGAPSALVAYGATNVRAIRAALIAGHIKGKLIELS